MIRDQGTHLRYQRGDLSRLERKDQERRTWACPPVMRLGIQRSTELSKKRARSAKGLQTRDFSPNDASQSSRVDWLDVRDTAWLNNVPTLTDRI
ncbi:hypothetical protein IG631_12942 [Alternaria alternata]|nr:hypothetical protein IG631_12942 [Alternaria alternata]